MRALLLAMLLFAGTASSAFADGAATPPAGDDSPYLPDPPPGPYDGTWTSGQDVLSVCRDAPEGQPRCRIDLLVAILKAGQDSPSRICLPTPPANEDAHWDHEHYLKPLYGWLGTAKPEVLKQPWEDSVAMAAAALWPCG